MPPAATAPASADLLAATRAGHVAVEAIGTGSDQMTMKVTNQTNQKLKIVLPPGLIATGATGQFGGVGGVGSDGRMGGFGGGGGGCGMGGVGGGGGGMAGGGGAGVVWGAGC